jgi:hypothetical protein
MKALWLLLSISIYLHGQQPPIPYQDQQSQKGYFKELRMQFYETHQKSPGIFNGLGILFVGVGIYQPTLMAGSAIVASIAGLLTYTQEKDKDMRQRKEDKDRIAYMFFANGPLECIERECQQDEYEESDIESLKKQNTPYLIYVLEKYAHLFACQSDTAKKSTQVNYSAALDALKRNYADLHAALYYFKQKKPLNNFAIQWLEKNSPK